MTTEELVIQIVTRGADTTQRDLQRTQAAVGGLRSETQTLATGVRSAVSSVSDLGGVLLTAASSAAALAGVLAVGTGVRTAMRYQQISVALETVIGSADKAAIVMQKLIDMGARTAFDTAELAQFASIMLSTGSTAETVTDELKALADAMAFSGVPREFVSNFLYNLMQIRSMARVNAQDLRQMFMSAPGIGKILGAGLGVKGTFGMAELRQAAATMSGREIFEAVVRGAGMVAGGTAERYGTRVFGFALANLWEQLNRVMEPTGQIILRILGPLTGVVMQTASLLGNINRLTHGFAGLGWIAVGVYRYWSLLVGSFRSAAVAIQQLRASIDGLTASAARASGVGGAATGAAAAGAGAAAAIGLGGWRGALGKLGGALRTPGGLGAAGALAGGIIGLLAGQNRTLELIGNALSMGGIGAMVGKVGGPWGAAIGAIAGIGLAVWEWLSRQNAEKGTSPAVKEQQKTNAILQDIKASLVGGGGRARQAVALAEAEIAIRRALGWGYA